MQTIDRRELQQKMRENPRLPVVEVLQPPEFEKYHLPNAINVPLGKDFDDRIQRAVPDKSTPVVVYCADLECDASPTAAKKMERLGYERVFDYADGKADWKENVSASAS